MAQVARNWSDEQKALFKQRAAKTIADARVRFSSWSIKTQIECCVLRYTCLILEVLPELGEIRQAPPKNEIWSAAIVKKYAHFHLYFQIEVRRKRDNSYVCARTVYRWFYAFVTAIASYCHDPEDGQMAGSVLLVNGGLYNLLAAQVEERTSWSPPSLVFDH